jgi:acyl-CoA synthetase (AMP-forming)/AMP-acid ligase II
MMTSLSDNIREMMHLDPGASAIEFHGQWHNWGQLNAVSDQLEMILQKAGIGPGTRIAGVLRNTPDVAAAIVGVITSARCIVTLNPMLPDDKLAADVFSLAAPVVFAISADWAREPVREAARALGALCIELTGDQAEPVRVIQQSGSGPFLREAAGIGIEMLTSGTTGAPKRIPLKSASFEKMILDAAVFESRKAGEAPRLRSAVSILNTPFSHIGGLFGLFTTLSAGRRICMLDRFEVETFVSAVERHRPKAVSAPPSALRMILDASVDPARLQSLQVFDVDDNKITAIQPNTFIGLKSVKIMYLSNNNIQSIDRNAFVGLVTLDDVWLQTNPISNVNPSYVMSLCSSNPKCKINI